MFLLVVSADFSGDYIASSLRKDCGYPIFRGSEFGGIVGFVEANPKATLCVDRW